MLSLRFLFAVNPAEQRAARRVPELAEDWMPAHLRVTYRHRPAPAAPSGRGTRHTALQRRRLLRRSDAQVVQHGEALAQGPLGRRPVSAGQM
jgi:hypothetical protein